MLSAALLLAAFGLAPRADPDLDGRIVTAIRIEGLRFTKERIVRRELKSREGEPFQRTNLDRDVERLDRLRVFSSIAVTPHSTAGGVEIEIRVRETFPYLPTLSLSVSDENGVSAGPGVKSVNFLGRAIALSAAARFGGATEVELFVSDPFVAGNHVSYEGELSHGTRENALDAFSETATGAGLKVGSFWGEKGRIGGLVSWTRIEAAREGVTLSPDGVDDVSRVGLFVGYDSRDLWSNPKRGFWNEVEISKSGAPFGGVGDFWTVVVDVRRYQPLWRRQMLLLSSLGTYQTGEVGTDIPIYWDFHIGGTNTVRGWPLSSRVGKNELLNTIEHRYSLLEPRPVRVARFDAYVGLQLAAFVDFGHAWSEPHELALDRFIAGYGVGLQLLVPFIDVVRLDVAYGKPGAGPSFHFGIYPKVVMQRERVR